MTEYLSSIVHLWTRTFIRILWLNILGILILHLCCLSIFVETTERRYINEFAVKIIGGDSIANHIAQKYGFINHGQIGNLKGYYLFKHHGIEKRSLEYNHHHHGILKQESSIVWVEQQHSKRRTKRDGLTERSVLHYRSRAMSDPLYRDQWYLVGGGHGGYDMNVLDVWNEGISGKGVVVTILDDGIQTNHPDLIQNYDGLASADINDRDDNPMPQDNGDNKHGTRCAGEVAATAFNEFCGVGIAYNASIGGVRMLDGTVTDEVEARALSLNPDHIDIYSASWGPEDDGKTVDGPGRLAKHAFIQGITEGRKGLGSIFVWASGNGGRFSDNCNCDGYTNSIYTLSISSATQRGLKPWYLEECSSTLATTYSSGTPGQDSSVVTVDMDMQYFESLRKGRKPNLSTLCTHSHTGTSASAPIAAAICALALEANRHLTWRDMQHLVVLTSRPEPLLHETGWQTNAVGRKVSHKFGYGLMDAAAMVKLAKKWVKVGKQHVCYTPSDNTEREIPNKHGEQLEVSMFTDACAHRSTAINYLEHVQVQISLQFIPRGNLHIKLISPSGTSSSVLLPRPRDKEEGSLNNWPLLSVHYWGEKAAGKWKLIIRNEGTHRSPLPGILQKWSLILYGTESPPSVRLLSDGRTHRYISVIRDTSEKSVNLCFKEEKFLKVDTGECITECPEGHFENKTDYICSPCNFPCLNCYGPNEDNCLSCSKSYYLQKDYCVEDCSIGSYKDENSGDCLPCMSQCSACENNPSFCLSCKSGFYLFENKCHLECPLHTYHDVNESCANCHITCLTCKGFSETDCTSCPVNYFLHFGKCVEECPKHYFGDLQTKECIECDLGCKQCDAEKCIICDDEWQLHDGSCKKACKLGKNCIKDFSCHASCKECNGPAISDCIECDSTKFMYDGHCVNKCPDGYFANQYQHCQLCYYTCLKCLGNGMGQCEACIEGYVLHGGNCLPDCPKGLYKTNNNQCEYCDRNCATCVGKTDKNCTSCKADSYLIAGKCYFETNCPDNYYLRELSSGKECLPCHHSCQTCKGPGPTSCLSCPMNVVLRNEICLSCLDNEYFDQETKECKHCHPACGRCYGGAEDQCQSCLSPLKLDVAHHRCLPCCSRNIPKFVECCICNEDSDACINSDDHPRSIKSFQKSEKSLQSLSMDSVEKTNIVFIILGICGAAVTLFFIIFGILQIRSLESCQRFNWKRNYKRVPEFTTSFDNKMERVLLAEQDPEEDDDEDDIYCKT